jgi:hypothetical protein
MLPTDLSARNAPSAILVSGKMPGFVDAFASLG